MVDGVRKVFPAYGEGYWQVSCIFLLAGLFFTECSSSHPHMDFVDWWLLVQALRTKFNHTKSPQGITKANQAHCGIKIKEMEQNKQKI